MSVKCLIASDQRIICNLFNHHQFSITQLASNFGRSRRTIIRVLEDNQIDPGIHRRVRLPKPKPTQLTHQVQLPFIPSQKTWIRRVVERVTRAFA